MRFVYIFGWKNRGVISLCSSYRDASEVQAVRKERDPINLLTAYALEGNLVTEDELKVCVRT